MLPKIKLITDEMLEALEALMAELPPHQTLILAWAELQQGKWPSTIPTGLPHDEEPSKPKMAAVGNWIIKKVGRYNCSKHWNCVHLGTMTEKDFESFWQKNYCNDQAPRLADGVRLDPADISKEEHEASEPDKGFTYEGGEDADAGISAKNLKVNEAGEAGERRNSEQPQPAKKRKKKGKKKKKSKS